MCMGMYVTEREEGEKSEGERRRKGGKKEKRGRRHVDCYL